MSFDNFKMFFSDHLPRYKGEDIFFFGIGNKYRADDSFGIILAEELRKTLPEQVFAETDDYQEKLLELSESLKGKLVLFLDVAEFDEDPGTIRVFEAEELDDNSAGFHKVPLKLYMSLIKQAGNETYLIAVQPKTLKDTFYEPEISKEVQEAIDEIENLIFTNIRKEK
ncbi:MAG TPA: hydrogenase maturation protease [Firmicutes bacterium]|nr:hydrogenase maturation protease [Bacillota bacterium]